MAPPSANLLVSWPLSRSQAGKKFSYRNLPYTVGALRVISVSKLLKGVIELWEYPSVTWRKKSEFKKFAKSNAEYTAISHVWKASADVVTALTTSQNIDIETPPPTQSISWEGLQDVALAIQSSRKLGRAQYLWLDLLCLNQMDRTDVLRQVCIMADIYRYSRSVVIMIGGVGAVHRVEQPSGWIDRAWTLQETVLNRGSTYVYIRWKNTYPNPIKEATGTGSWKLEVIKQDTAYSFCLVHIRQLLDMADTKLLNGPVIRTVDGMTPLAGDVPRRALRAAISDVKQVQYTGMWRSLFLRTSSIPADVIYSAMGCFDQPINPAIIARIDIVPVDPFRFHRSPTYVFNDFCRKMATNLQSGPAFLAIGGVEGNDLPYQEDSLIPVFPHTEGRNQQSSDQPPVLTFGQTPEWVGFHVAHSPYYVESFDMAFITHSYPHVVNANLIRVRRVWRRNYPKPVLGQKVSRVIAQAQIGSMTGSLYYWADDDLKRVQKGTVMALYVGTVGDMRKNDFKIRFYSPGSSLKGAKYLLFLEYHRHDKRWNIIGNGAFRPNKKWVNPSQRSVITLGSGAQTSLQSWPTTSRRWIDTRMTKFKQNSYGVLPVRDFEPPRVENLSITWFGKKRQKPNNKPGFKRFFVNVDINDFTQEGLVREFAPTRNVQVVACKSVNPPPTAKVDKKAPVIRQLGIYKMPFCYDGWTRNAILQISKDGLPGVLVPKNRTKVAYWVQIWFGRSVMYLMVKNYGKARKEYWDITPIPYGPVDGPTLNKRYGNFKAQV